MAYAQLHQEHEATLSEFSSTESDLRQSESLVYQLEGDLKVESNRLRSCRDELDGVSARLTSALSTIRDVESSLGLSQSRNSDLAGQVDELVSQIDELTSRFSSCSSALGVARNEATTLNSEVIRLSNELAECIGIANDRQRRINDCIDTANSRILWITDIPRQSIFGTGFGDPYENLRQQYNDLVNRFNSAVKRSNDLAELLARSLRELE